MDSDSLGSLIKEFFNILLEFNEFCAWCVRRLDILSHKIRIVHNYLKSQQISKIEFPSRNKQTFIDSQPMNSGQYRSIKMPAEKLEPHPHANCLALKHQRSKNIRWKEE
jgi:hypothetical protein